jgi:hypothetical protein
MSWDSERHSQRRRDANQERPHGCESCDTPGDVDNPLTVTRTNRTVTVVCRACANTPPTHHGEQ